MRKLSIPCAARRVDLPNSRPWHKFARFSVACTVGVFWLAAGVSARSQQSQSSSQPPSQSHSSAPGQSQAKPSTGTTPANASAAKSPAPAPVSLAEAARLARAEHANGKSARVFTNDDLSNISATISVVGSAPSGATARKANPGSQDANDGSGDQEQYWRSKAQAIKDQIALVDHRIADEKAEISKGGSFGFAAPVANSPNAPFVIHDHDARIKVLEKQKADLQKQLDDLAVSARRAGADPGWVH